MIFPISIYVEEAAGGGVQPGRFTARPLFSPIPVHTGEKMTRALTRLGNDLRQRLKELGECARHDDLARWAFAPLFEERTLELRLEFPSSTPRRTFFLAGHAALGRHVWFCPRVPNFSFEVFPGQDLGERAEEALTKHLRELEKEGEVDLADYVLPGRARLTVLELELHPAALARPARKSTRAVIFGGDEKMDGDEELRRVGRSLSSMYPDDLERAIGREREIEELARLLAAGDRRPILLVGPRQVGKTAVVQELVWRMQARKKERFGGKRDVWLVSPMRLISGMSFLGQWENRVLAILEHARAKDLVLYFDDLPGLFDAGVSCGSDLNVVQVLKPALERREVRVLAEITPESWRVLRERDRGFADQFHIVPIEEPAEAETLRILTAVSRQLEDARGCTFDLEVVPAVYELHRRFGSDAAFPGKAAGFLRRLALRGGAREIIRDHALTEFREQSGLEIDLLDERKRLSRSQLVQKLQEQVKGQDHVLEALADRVVALKARLNDPRRPLGTLLLLGPTGVGKTQSAKALAEQLFGGPERLLRFDMNEFVDAASAARLTGTAREPDGLLTGAIRRQPFSVVLLDEVEKAAPEVFDVLLAVLDEGRLTDGLGRVADFTQSIILLTSNLGVAEARARLGFGEAGGRGEADDQLFVSAAEKFFRPEFFNRLDRVVPFRSLAPAHLEEIVRRLLADVLARDGLRRRKTWLQVTSAAKDQLVSLGHHPQLGARALKRVVEREVAQPVAEKLAALGPGECMIAGLDWTDGGFRLELRALAPVARTVFWPEAVLQERTAPAQKVWSSKVLEGAAAVLDRIERDLEAAAPAGRIEVGRISAAHERYFHCREQVKNSRRLLHAVDAGRTPPRAAPDVAYMTNARPVKIVRRQFDSTRNPRLDRQRDAIALRDVATELAFAPEDSVDVPDSPLTELLRELALLDVMVAGPGDEPGQLLVFRAHSSTDASFLHRVSSWYGGCLSGIWGVTATPLHPSEPAARSPGEVIPRRIEACYVRGARLERLWPGQPCSVLTERADGSTGLIAITRHAVESEAVARVQMVALARDSEFIDPASFGPIVHRLSWDGGCEDFRTGLSVPAGATLADYRALWLSSLSLPPELNV